MVFFSPSKIHDQLMIPLHKTNMSPENKASEKGNASHLPTINLLGDVRFREG